MSRAARAELTIGTTWTPARLMAWTGMPLIGRPAPRKRTSAFSSTAASSSSWKQLTATMMLTPIIPADLRRASRISRRRARTFAATGSS